MPRASPRTFATRLPTRRPPLPPLPVECGQSDPLGCLGGDEDSRRRDHILGDELRLYFHYDLPLFGYGYWGLALGVSWVEEVDAL